MEALVQEILCDPIFVGPSLDFLLFLCSGVVWVLCNWAWVRAVKVAQWLEAIIAFQQRMANKAHLVPSRSRCRMLDASCSMWNV
jgi:hypothetical protein